jgi:hypothetical protein
LAAVALAALALFALIGPRIIPFPMIRPDTENYEHWVATNFAYASSPLDQSVMSPFQGLGGLVQPIAVWLHPAYLVQRWLGGSEPREWPTVVCMILMGLSTFALGRATGLPSLPAAVVAQAVAIVSFHPYYDWLFPFTHLNGAHLYSPLPGFALPAALGNLFLALFAWLGTQSRRANLACALLLPVVFTYSVVVDCLYTAIFFVPIGLCAAGIFLASRTRDEWLWRLGAAGFSLIVAVAAGIPQTYRGLMGYVARGVFPNELYVEVQKWDYNTALMFQGALAPWLVAVAIIAAGIGCWRGPAMVRGFCGAVLVCIAGLAAVSLVYVYGGTRWSQPVPSYVEAGAHASYAVATAWGVRLAWGWLGTPRWQQELARPAIRWSAALALPLVALLAALIASQIHATAYARAENAIEHRHAGVQRGIVRNFLEPQFALGADGRFRGSVANLIGVPGGGLQRRLNEPATTPYSKRHLDFILDYLRTFDSDLFMTGLWNRRIPTLEDNNHLITPPFHFLVSRLLSRPHDYHSRNWALVTAARPRLMAALGCRYLLADDPQNHPLLTERARQTNAHGITIYAYELADVNLGHYSPTETVLSTDATEALGLLGDPSFDFRHRALVHEQPIDGLVAAESAAFFFEKGGVRVRARSTGSALLVLPVQFSNALRIVSGASSRGGSPIRLLRVNLLETGVLFAGEIDCKFAHIFGPLRATAGRRRDIEDCKRLGIRETGEIPYPPDYQPLARRKPSGSVAP